MLIYALDDERLALENLTDSIKKAIPDAKIIVFHSAEEVFDYSPDENCDIAFLDVKLKTNNGIAVAKYLVEQNPRVNLIFTTGYTEYAVRAFRIHASGYILKPVTPEKIRVEMQHLRFPLNENPDIRVNIRAFGPFEIYIDDAPVSFKYAKTKELLAVLVDRKGALCSSGTISGCLWENDDADAHRSYLKNLRRDLLNILTAYGCEEIVTRSKGNIGILPDKVNCDYFNYIRGVSSKNGIDTYRGEYMSQYSWAEYTHALLDEAYLQEHLK